MLLKENNNEGKSICLYDSTNIKKTIYDFKTKKLMVFFIKSRKKMVHGDEKYYFKKDGVFLMGSVYIYKNIDNKIFNEFKENESQGSYMNNVIVKNNNFTNKMKLLSIEIEDIVNNSSI